MCVCNYIIISKAVTGKNNGTMNNNMNMENLFIPLRNMIGKSFSVKDYQRGYKWDEKEILELLNDVNEHNPEKGKYCLQPIIVRENIDSIELIDGQQRITSIYLILHFLRHLSNEIYHISYETREASKKFLEEKIHLLNPYMEAKLSWEDFLAKEESSKYDNVDIYHFYIVYQNIYKWFQDKTDEFKINFHYKLLNNVHIIWYDIDSSSNNQQIDASAEQVFLNLNAGKIALTSAELIKGLFILECKENKNYTKEIAKLKSTELALEWDQIENRLHDDSFWFFICDNDKYNNSPTRIDFLFDIINEKSAKNNDELFSYHIYEKKQKDGKVLNWLEVKNTFNKLLEWYENKKIFHYVGFLIVSKLKTLNQIITISKGISKKEFEIKLIGFIKEEFLKKRKDENKDDYFVYSLDDLSYEDARKECEKVLLLLNVLYYINNRSSNKFPFDLYKKDNWSVEHINPQNPRDFENVTMMKKWFESNLTYYKRENTNEESKLIAQINTILTYFDNVTVGDARKLAQLGLAEEQNQKINDLVAEISRDLHLHGISNLALLDKESNSKLSNKLFLEKRALILKLDQNGGEEKEVFIPICTKNVFAKIYTKDKESVLDAFFGRKDMDDYYEFIESQLLHFLPQIQTTTTI